MTGMTPTLAELIGPMLGAGFVFAAGEVVEEDHARGEVLRHTFWARRHDWRVERSDGLVFVDGPEGSVTRYRSRVLESRQGFRRPAGFHLPDRMLRPAHAYIWGRPGEDWRLSEDVTDAGAGRVRVALVSTEGRDSGGAHVEVEVSTGRMFTLATPSFTWSLTRLEEDEREDSTDLFVA